MPLVAVNVVSAVAVGPATEPVMVRGAAAEKVRGAPEKFLTVTVTVSAAE